MPGAVTENVGADKVASNQMEVHSASEGAAVEHALTSTEPPASGHHFTRRRKLLIGVIGALVLIVVCVIGVPWIGRAFSTVSTDDAYVNGHVTFVAPRVGGQIVRVLVDDNNRVRKGQLLAQLDKEPYQIAISRKEAAVDTAKADLQAAKAAARGIEANASSRRWALQHAVENVDNQIALLHARVAEFDKSKAALTLAQVEFDRTKQLLTSGTASRQEFDRRQAGLTTANAGVTQSLAEIYQIRVSLGLPAQPDKGEDLGSVPPDLDDTFSAVLQAQSELIQSAAELGVVHSFDERPKAMVAAFERQGDIDTTFARLAADAPAVKQAEAKLEAAQRELAQAGLELRQNLMAIRSLKDIWVDANFKETELRDLRIGQPVDVYVDMYGGRRVFKGRVSGFTMGTGSTLALLPGAERHGQFRQSGSAASGPN